MESSVVLCEDHVCGGYMENLKGVQRAMVFVMKMGDDGMHIFELVGKQGLKHTYQFNSGSFTIQHACN